MYIVVTMAMWDSLNHTLVRQIRLEIFEFTPIKSGINKSNRGLGPELLIEFTLPDKPLLIFTKYCRAERVKA